MQTYYEKPYKWIFLAAILALLVIVFSRCSTLNQVVSPAPAKTLAEVQAIGSASKCQSYNWPSRGHPPKGYLQGLALVYAKALCHKDRGELKFSGATSKGTTAHDALAYYGKEASLHNTFVLLAGLGIRESSGQYCEGKDASANNVAGYNTEAGGWQTSFNAIATLRTSTYKDTDAADAAQKLFDSYKNSDGKGCFKDVFAQGVSCSASKLKIYGSGEAATFQTISKTCPAFAAEFASIMVRRERQHYGPLNTKAAEMRPECDSMFSDVEILIRDFPGTCENL